MTLPLPAIEQRGRGDVPKPFLKWAGGKGQLLRQFCDLYPPAKKVNRYVEPFLGSGAVFLHVQELLRPKTAILSDSNEELINAFQVVRDQLKPLIKKLEAHKRDHSEEYFYDLRARGEVGLSPVDRAARTIYLNKTCFNGLYRVNSKGLFNVPFGKFVNPGIVNPDAFSRTSLALQTADLRAASFQQALAVAKKGDFVYFDPPYHPLSDTAFFTSYTRGVFGQAEQEELAAGFAALAARGCLVMLSNSDTPLVRKLYKPFDIRTVEARRNINSKTDRRGPIQEVVVINYEPGAETKNAKKKP